MTARGALYFGASPSYVAAFSQRYINVESPTLVDLDHTQDWHTKDLILGFVFRQTKILFFTQSLLFHLFVYKSVKNFVNQDKYEFGMV